jgi:hypothetical protein
MSMIEPLHHSFGKYGAISYFVFSVVIAGSFVTYQMFQLQAIAMLYRVSIVGALSSAVGMAYWWIVEWGFPRP